MAELAAPPVTIGVPVYNGEQFLAQALDSIARQDFTDIEVLIGDNASTDGTEEISREFMRRDDRFRYQRNSENVGGAKNCNLVLARARSPLFKWAYADDVNEPQLVRRCVEALTDAGASAVLAFPRVALIDAIGDRCGEHDDADLDMASDDLTVRLDVLLRRVVGQVQFGLIRTEHLRSAGGTIATVGGEMIMPLSLCLRGKMILVPEQLLNIRMHAERSGGNRRSEARWVNPNMKAMAFPYSRVSLQMLRAVSRSPLSARDKRRCAEVVLRAWTVPNRRSIVGDFVRLPEDLGVVRSRR